MTNPANPTTEEKKALEGQLEECMCAKLLKVMHWMTIMKMTGNTATDYDHFQWCCSEIIKLRHQIKGLEKIITVMGDDERTER